jgi:hypothetical protein
MRIQMFELQVYSENVNIALDKAATQSSTYKDKARFEASKAIDGDSTTLFSHTGRDDCIWYELDLGENNLFAIESIKIVNRWCEDEHDSNECLCRLLYVTVSLLDNGKWVDATLTGNTCGVLEWEHGFTHSEEYY